jgi:hypothetical protein
MVANAVRLGLLEPPISGQLSKYQELWFTESSVVSPRHKLRHRCGRHQNGSSLRRALECNLYFSAMATSRAMTTLSWSLDGRRKKRKSKDWANVSDPDVKIMR